MALHNTESARSLSLYIHWVNTTIRDIIWSFWFHLTHYPNANTYFSPIDIDDWWLWHIKTHISQIFKATLEPIRLYLTNIPVSLEHSRCRPTEEEYSNENSFSQWNFRDNDKNSTNGNDICTMKTPQTLKCLQANIKGNKTLSTDRHNKRSPEDYVRVHKALQGGLQIYTKHPLTRDSSDKAASRHWYFKCWLLNKRRNKVVRESQGPSYHIC